MRIKNLWYKTGAVLLLIIAMASCEDDLTTIGSEVLGSENPNGILDDSYSVLAYSKKMNPVQTNQLPAYQLGVYNHSVYGKSTIGFLSQLVMNTNNPKFGDSATVDSVFVYLPYFSTETAVDSTITYKTDSIYGADPINIRIFESNYYLRDYDPDSGFEEIQSYYSNQSAVFEGFLGQELGRVDDFKPSDKGFVFEKDDDKKEHLAPGLRVKLDSLFFQEKIIDKEGSIELRNNTNFRNYLRGLYFKVDSPTDNGSLFLFDASKANLIVYYSYTPDDSDDRKQKTFELDFSGVNVNTIDNAALPHHIESALANPDTINGSEKLYLRGGDGIITVVNLFGEDVDGNGVPDELELLRAKKWLVNEANLILYVDQDEMKGSEPERIKIYDLKNNKLLADYDLDPTNGLPALDAQTNHLGRLERGSDNKGKYYKLKITNHISNLINKDSTNVPLGIVVSQNVKNRSFQKLSSPQEPHIEKIPAGSVISSQGTILHGSNSPIEEKKLKLRIYYTEPN